MKFKYIMELDDFMDFAYRFLETQTSENDKEVSKVFLDDLVQELISKSDKKHKQYIKRHKVKEAE